MCECVPLVQYDEHVDRVWCHPKINTIKVTYTIYYSIHGAERIAFFALARGVLLGSSWCWKERGPWSRALIAPRPRKLFPLHATVCGHTVSETGETFAIERGLVSTRADTRARTKHTRPHARPIFARSSLSSSPVAYSTSGTENWQPLMHRLERGGVAQVWPACLVSHVRSLGWVCAFARTMPSISPLSSARPRSLPMAV